MICLFVSVCLSLAICTAVKVDLHFETLCKQCQIHMAALFDDVGRGGYELSFEESGVLQEVEMRIDYYGQVEKCAISASKRDTEHGPDMCLTDRISLCAQSLYGGDGKGAAMTWFPFTHCMMQNIDVLKCGHNEHCDTHTDFLVALRAVFPMCTAATHVDGDAIWTCATSGTGAELANESYKRTDATLTKGFAPAFVDGVYQESADDGTWRKSPDQLSYGKHMLGAICDRIVVDAGTNASAAILPAGCMDKGQSFH